MDNRNMILAIVLSIVIMFGFQFYMESQLPVPQPGQESAQQAAKSGAEKAPGAPAVPDTEAGAEPPVPIPGAATKLALDQASLEAALTGGPRVKIDSPRLRGTISLRGARFDDLTLLDYRETLDPKSAQIRLLHPLGSKNPYYAEFGWVSTDTKTPGLNALWKADRDRLAPGRPLKLHWQNDDGVVFFLIYQIDQNYMFTVTQQVENRGSKPATVHPFGRLSRTGTPEITGFYILHEGLLGVFDGILQEVEYEDIQETKTISSKTTGGWIGITDKYWMTALIPDQKMATEARFTDRAVKGTDVYRVDFRGDAQDLAPGKDARIENHFFAGAKEATLLFAYAQNKESKGFWDETLDDIMTALNLKATNAEALGIDRFDLAIDWGWFEVLTKPIFLALLYFNDFTGNMGFSILLLTVLIKLAFFPLANKSYRAMTQMKKLQPEMVKIRERFSDDKTRMNQEVMALYKSEKVNPAAGCLPILPQIPVFFALYKVLFVTIEMRQAPFIGWIHDLSAPDPLGLLTVFGLFEWNIPEMLDIANIGIWPLIMGGSMYLQQKLNPPPTDPTQAKIFMFLPFMFTFMLARFPSGLVIYWAWNNMLSIAQQYVIMKRAGVPIGGGQTPAAKAAAARNTGPKASGAKTSGAKTSGTKTSRAKTSGTKTSGANNPGGKNPTAKKTQTKGQGQGKTKGQGRTRGKGKGRKGGASKS